MWSLEQTQPLLGKLGTGDEDMGRFEEMGTRPWWMVERSELGSRFTSIFDLLCLMPACFPSAYVIVLGGSFVALGLQLTVNSRVTLS